MQVTREQQQEWAALKYDVMAHSQREYNAIRQLFKGNEWNEEKEGSYRQLIQNAYDTVPTRGSLLNAYQHVWGYFKRIATPEELVRYRELSEHFSSTTDELLPFLRELTVKYQMKYLLNSNLLFPTKKTDS